MGYARVSTLDQNPALQQVALEKVDCKRIFTDTASGSTTDRLQLAEALAYVDTRNASTCVRPAQAGLVAEWPRGATLVASYSLFGVATTLSGLPRALLFVEGSASSAGWMPVLRVRPALTGPSSPSPG